MSRVFIAALGVAVLAASCSALPNDGPRTEALADASSDLLRQYEVFEVTPALVRIMTARPSETFSSRFGDYRGAVEPRIGIGDMLAVTIWEAGAGGLFSAPMVPDRFTPGSRTATVPEQPVGRDGAITVPYAGRVVVANQTPSQVQATIERQLAGKAVQPQVLVTVSRAVASAVTVTGEVGAGGRIGLTPRGDRVLDVIATAGGARVPVGDAAVRLSRGGVTVSVPMSAIVSNPRENIYLRPGDTLTVVRDPRAVIVHGATGRSAEIPFETDQMTVAQALARAGGLLDNRADPQGVFLFRFEPAEIVRQIQPASPLAAGHRLVPVIYRFNLAEANGMFMAQAMPLRSQDVLYVTNAPLSQLQKALQLFATIVSPALSGAAIYNVAK